MRVSCIAIVLLTGCGFHISGAGSATTDDADAPMDMDTGSDSGMDADIDARDIDASIDGPFVTPCPADYSVTSGTSKYKLQTVGRTYRAQYMACMTEGTHLAVIDSAQEALALRQLIDGTSGLPTSSFGPFVFIGSAQQPGQPMTSAGRAMGWISATGPFTSASFWENGEPNDISGVENGDEDFAAIWRGHDLIVDLAGNGSFAGVCECDGLPVTLDFQQLMQ
jgi:hypothetical protein